MFDFSLTLFMRGQAFLSLTRRLARLLLPWALSLSVAFPANGFHLLSAIPTMDYASFRPEALSIPGFFTRSRHSLSSHQFQYIRRIATSWMGDDCLQSLRLAYRQELAISFLLMALDSLLTLGVPFLGQALYDIAARGSHASESLQSMIFVTGLLIAAEGLDPFRRYLQFRMTRIISRFTADVRYFLLVHDSHGSIRAPRSSLILQHGPAFAVRNIEIPLKLPLVLIHGMISGGILWAMDPVVAAVAIGTALGLAFWSSQWSKPLSCTSRELKEAVAHALDSLTSPDGLADAKARLEHISQIEIRQASQSQWFDGVVDRVGTIILMTGVMLWGAWHQYWTGWPTTGRILALLALSWHVQFKITALFALIKLRLEAESASFLLPPKS